SQRASTADGSDTPGIVRCNGLLSMVRLVGAAGWPPVPAQDTPCLQHGHPTRKPQIPGSTDAYMAVQCDLRVGTSFAHMGMAIPIRGCGRPPGRPYERQDS